TLVRRGGGTGRTIGLVLGPSGLAGLVSVLAVAALLDRFGRRIFLLAGLATMSAAAGAFLLVDRIGPGIFLLRAVQGLAFAAGFNAASTLAAEFAPEGRRAAASACSASRRSPPTRSRRRSASSSSGWTASPR